MFRHRFDPSSVVAAVLFLGLAMLYLADGLGRANVPVLPAMPGVLAGLGVIGVLRIVFRSRREP